MSVEITPVRSRQDLIDFVGLPFRLHAGTRWIPPLKLERYLFLTRKLNAFFTHGEAEYLLARRNGRVVGRITAQVDFEFNQYHASRWGTFGFLEFEDDQEIVDELLRTAEVWCRSRGCDRMVGPMNFQINDEAGVMVEGFEREPLIREPWHPPYYRTRCEAAGLIKAMDLFGWDLSISDRERLNPILPRIAERARTRHGITIRKMERRHLRREMDEFAKVYNAAWSHNWGFVPYSKADLDSYAIDMQLVYARDWFMIAEQDSKTIAMAITIPDIHQIYKKMQGRLLPLGWWYYLNRARIIDRVRVGFLGVLPEYQHTGVAAALYMEHFDVAARSRQKQGEASFILEVNTSMNRGLEAMGGRLVKRWRVYERLLDPGAAPSAPAKDLAAA
jgi:GNAT superfamily N-acetyltransferase